MSALALACHRGYHRAHRTLMSMDLLLHGVAGVNSQEYLGCSEGQVTTLALDAVLRAV